MGGRGEISETIIIDMDFLRTQTLRTANTASGEERHRYNLYCDYHTHIMEMMLPLSLVK